MMIDEFLAAQNYNFLLENETQVCILLKMGTNKLKIKKA